MVINETKRLLHQDTECFILKLTVCRFFTRLQVSLSYTINSVSDLILFHSEHTLVENVWKSKYLVFSSDGKSPLNGKMPSDLIFGPKITDHLIWWRRHTAHIFTSLDIFNLFISINSFRAQAPVYCTGCIDENTHMPSVTSSRSGLIWKQ